MMFKDWETQQAKELEQSLHHRQKCLIFRKLPESLPDWQPIIGQLFLNAF
jgi:hypothetical protein